MIVKEIQPGPFIDWSLDGTLLCEKDGELIVGLGDAYVASVLIPPAKYKLTEAGVDENDNPVYESEKLPLDTEAVQLILWQYQKSDEEVK